MTAEMIQAALTAVAEEAAKAAVKRSVTITMMGHATAIGGLAAGLPTADATGLVGRLRHARMLLTSCLRLRLALR